MGSTSKIFFVSFGILVTLFLSQSKAQNEKYEIAFFVKRSVNFMMKPFYKLIARNTNDNFLTSPLSLNYALQLLSSGAAGKSLVELIRVLEGIPTGDSVQTMLRSYQAFTNLTKIDENIILASKIFADKSNEIKQEYKILTKSAFDADVELLDLVKDPESSVKIINDFVDRSTNHTINTIIDPGTLKLYPENMVIINVLYFQCQWRKLFSIPNDRTFFGLQREYQVKMMEQNHPLEQKYFEDDIFQFVEIPFGGDYSFLVVLPKEKKNMIGLLDKIEERISEADKRNILHTFLQLRDHAKYKFVKVHLPTFKMEQKLNLKDTLTKMGIVNIFTPAAEFPKISASPIYVDDIIQKTFIEVTNAGVIAAAATEVDFARKSAEINPIETYEVNCNHPFIYGIVHNSTNVPLFFGRYMKP